MLSFDCPFVDAVGMTRFLRGTVRDANKDWWFVSEGAPGAGKSTTKDQICRRVDPRLSLEDNIFDLKHLMDVMEDGRKRQVYPIDEGIQIFHNQDWASWQAKALTKLIRMMRVMNSLWGIAVVDFEGLHPFLRDYRVRQRFYHRPVFHEDGMGNGPPMPLWKDERFGYNEQRVVSRWRDLEFNLLIDSLDDDPQHAKYEKTKEDEFHRLVRLMRDRFGYEEEKEAKQVAKNGKARPKTKRKAPAMVQEA